VLAIADVPLVRISLRRSDLNLGLGPLGPLLADPGP
jgi:hypothetical protein